MWDLWEFIVSGRLPGTSVQVTFEHWLYAVSCFVMVALMYWAMRHYSYRHRMKLPQGPIDAFIEQ